METLNFKEKIDELITRGKVLGKGGMGIIETVHVNKNHSDYKKFIAEIAAWAEVRGDFRDVEIRFSGIRKEIKKKKLIIDNLIASSANSQEIQSARYSLSESVMILRNMQKEYVDERISILDKMSLSELENWISTLGKPLPKDMSFARKSTFTENSEVIDRLNEEFIILNLLQHENIITVYSGKPGSYLMEILDGYQGGDKFISETNNIQEIKSKVNYIIEGCKAIEKMHEFGIIHRDIKPENFMIKNGMVKFIDLGIARSDESINVTLDGSIMGTPNYMSLNQILAKQPNYNFDIYAISATLYSLVSGKEPYQVIFNKKTKKTLSTSEKIANIELLIMAKDSDCVPLPANRINKKIPEILNDIIEHGMEKHKTIYNTVYDFRRDLELFVNDEPYTMKVSNKKRRKKKNTNNGFGSSEPRENKSLDKNYMFLALIIVIGALLFFLFQKEEKKEPFSLTNIIGGIADVAKNISESKDETTDKKDILNSILDNVSDDTKIVGAKTAEIFTSKVANFVKDIKADSVVFDFGIEDPDLGKLVLLKSRADIKFKKIKNLQPNFDLEKKYEEIELLLVTANNFFNMEKYNNLTDKYEKIIEKSSELISLNKRIISELNKNKEIEKEGESR